MARLDALQVRTRHGLIVAVPKTLSAITTYVLLEQEDWFEKEGDFVRRFLKPGMTVVDIGANLGLYSLVAAHSVGPSGRVVAYEPGSEARSFLELSRDLNDAGQLEIVGAALSDGEREGRLTFAHSSELRTLGDDGETVRVASLDAEQARRRWGSVDFVKIDAEGEEERILAGGRRFFTDHSPLVMFEVRSGPGVNSDLLSAFARIGYRLFRQIVGEPRLVPVDSAQQIDSFELNLFAAKPDRVKSLAEDGLLVETILDWAPTDEHRRAGLDFWRRQPFAELVKHSTDAASLDRDCVDGFAGYAVWRDHKLQPTIRVSALAAAAKAFRAAHRRHRTPERASTWARVAWEWGWRTECVVALQESLDRLYPGVDRVDFAEPFWPASPRFDFLPPGARPTDWFVASMAEQFEMTRSHSSVFNRATRFVDWLCGQPNSAAEMERRRVLVRAHAGLRPSVPERLKTPARDHLNAETWRNGLVPGTNAFD